EPRLALRGGFEASPDVHATRIEPNKERLAIPVCAFDEVDRGLEKFLVDRLHALLGERAGVLALLLVPRSEARLVTRGVGRPCDPLHDPAWAKLRPKLRVFWIVRMFRFVLRVEMIEVAEELVEAVHCRQEFVAVAEVVLAELSGRVALWLQQLGNGRILL